MSQFYAIHPDNPQARLISQAVAHIRDGGVVIYPTDSGYALGCLLENKTALERICRIRQIDSNHNFTLAYVIFRVVALRSGRESSLSPDQEQHAVSLYVHLQGDQRGSSSPDEREEEDHRHSRAAEPHRLALLGELGEPLMSTSLILPGSDVAESDPYEIRDRLSQVVDLIIDGGYLGEQPTTVVDFSAENPEVVRYGAGDPTPFE